MNHVNQTTLCFVAGKSGGHIIPCLTLAQQIKNKNPLTRVLFFSTTAPIDTLIIGSSKNVDTHISLPLETVSVRKWQAVPALCLLLVRSLCISFYQLYKNKPSKVVTTGGYIAIPVCIAARLLRIPIELYELNVQPGKAIAWLAPHADEVRICFKKTAQLLNQVSCTVTDYPIRFNTQDKEGVPAFYGFGLNPLKKTVFILGGSQGSQFINGSIERVLLADPVLAHSLNIIHQTGPCDQQYWQLFYEKLGISAYVFTYCESLAPYYHGADLIISRAGAGALFEILYFNKPCIVIPLETAQDAHQYANAYEMVILNQRLFLLVRQEEISKDSTALALSMHKLLKS